MRMDGSQSLICLHRHCFDLARQGYVNLLSRSVATRYDRELFASRRTICKSGFYEPLHAVISQRISRLLRHRERPMILDAGCGEGSHAARIQESVRHSFLTPLLAVGIDLSKEGILHAASTYDEAIWCVAEERLRRAKLRDVPAVTVDLTILYGRNPSPRNE